MSKLAMRAVSLACAVALVTALAVVVTAGTAQAGERRWDVSESAYDQTTMPEQIGRNVRDGLVGIVDSLFQGAMSVVAIGSPRGGLLARKVATLGGDVIGIVDNNLVTNRVFKGVLSRQLLRYGAGGQGLAPGIGLIHDTEYAPRTQASDYTGDEAFHTKAYMEPSVLATLGAVVISDVIVRPAGSFVTIFGLRSLGEDLDKWGMDLIEQSFDVKFL